MKGGETVSSNKQTPQRRRVKKVFITSECKIIVINQLFFKYIKHFRTENVWNRHNSSNRRQRFSVTLTAGGAGCDTALCPSQEVTLLRQLNRQAPDLKKVYEGHGRLIRD